MTNASAPWSILYAAPVKDRDESFEIRKTICRGDRPLAPSVACQTPVTSAVGIAAVVIAMLVPMISSSVLSQSAFRESVCTITLHPHKTDRSSCTLPANGRRLRNLVS